MEPLPFFSRLVFAYIAFFRILFDGAFAARVVAVREGMPALPPKADLGREPRNNDAALLLLGLLQHGGRFVDFLQQDVSGFSDADVATAARVVHDGCKKAIAQHLVVEAVRTEDEGSKVEVVRGFDANAIKLVGDVRGDGPWNGTLRHRGWRAKSITLPQAMAGADVQILAQAEVEL